MHDSSEKYRDAMGQLTWQIHSINVHIEELGRFWAKSLGISGPQWTIISALTDLDKGDGVAVNAVSKKLHVDASFVTTQSKLLEKKGFVRRKTSSEDARVVKMSLTDKAQKNVARLAVQQETLHEFIFAEINSRDLTNLATHLALLEVRLEKACLKVVADF
jgi:DNA-binding MarR family transcriptional regulator